jgi:arginine decarboxylase
MAAQRNAATAAVGSAFPVFELPSDASAMNGALNGDSVVQAVARDA